MNRDREYEINKFVNLIGDMCSDYSVILYAEGGKLAVIDTETGKRYGILKNTEMGGDDTD